MTALAIVGGVIALFVLLALSAIWSGYVLTILWAWFVVPTFHLPQLSLAAAIGIAIVVKYLTHHVDTHEDNRSWDDKFAVSIGFALLFPLMALFFGWVVHFFM